MGSSSSAASQKTPFGPLLRRFRSASGLSQERLAHDAEISTRHLSCLETSRASPSKSMVLLLGSALDLPLRDRNALLEAAGFVAAYRDVPLAAPEASSLRQAIDLILNGLEPNGAVCVDRAWNVLQMNQGAMRLLGSFLDITSAPPEVMSNVLVATLHPLGFRPWIVNFEEVAGLTLERTRREALRFPDDLGFARAKAMIEKIPDLPNVRTTGISDGPFVTVHMRRGALEARFFTTISTIGTPIDATAEDIRIETYFPADEPTKRLMSDLAANSS